MRHLPEDWICRALGLAVVVLGAAFGAAVLLPVGVAVFFLPAFVNGKQPPRPSEPARPSESYRGLSPAARRRAHRSAMRSNVGPGAVIVHGAAGVAEPEAPYAVDLRRLTHDFLSGRISAIDFSVAADVLPLNGVPDSVSPSKPQNLAPKGIQPKRYSNASSEPLGTSRDDLSFDIPWLKRQRALCITSSGKAMYSRRIALAQQEQMRYLPTAAPLPMLPAEGLDPSSELR